ncbi:MAG: cellulase family glycosylhydrolase [Verrucomicrobiota bacterium]
MPRPSKRSLLSVLIFLSSWPAAALAQAPPAGRLERIRPSEDGTYFIRGGSKERFTVWGLNYDRDHAGRLLEDYWEKEWDTVVGDFHEMKALGANTVRIHPQLAAFMKNAEQPREENLQRLRKLLTLAEETGLYLDITGLGCYHKAEVPAWYNALEESARWETQARFWKAVAGVCRENPAVFCYNLMNEPLVSGGDQKTDWLPGIPLGGKHFVQRITIDSKGREDEEIARLWIWKLTEAIRTVDDAAMITVGVIPWAQVFKGAKPLFHSPEAGAPLDFVSVHLYPREGKLEDDLAALKVYGSGKPLLIEEIFPLSAGVEATEAFIRESGRQADGWISFYWGQTIEECGKKGDLAGGLTAAWLRRFQSLSPQFLSNHYKR